MDNLLCKFDQATDLDQLDQNNAFRQHNYKNNDKLSSKQQQRRNEILTNRLSKRDKLIASIRRLVSDVASDDEDQATNSGRQGANQIIGQPSHLTPDDGILAAVDTSVASSNSSLDHNNPMPLATSSPSPSNSALNTSTQNQDNRQANNSQNVGDKKFRNKAMLSEWLVDRPMDFESEWILKATPVGRRCLVFARKGETVAYSRTGQFIKKFQSSLPGGGRQHISHCKRQFAIVDCIYVQQNNTFYLMDALAWNEQKLYESEASFRFFWLQSRYNENREKFLTTSNRNECRFYCLHTYSASDQDILTALNTDPLIKEHNLQLDGLLFFHIRGPYVPGANPLVLWIKPEMVNRVLTPANQ